MTSTYKILGQNYVGLTKYSKFNNGYYYGGNTTKTNVKFLIDYESSDNTNNIIKSTDGGTTWSKVFKLNDSNNVNTGDQDVFRNIASNSKTVITYFGDFLSGNYYVAYSNDQGNTWQQISTSYVFQSITVVNDVFYAQGYNLPDHTYNIWKSNDGLNWQIFKADVGTGTIPLPLQSYKDNLVYVSGYQSPYTVNILNTNTNNIRTITVNPAGQVNGYSGVFENIDTLGPITIINGVLAFSALGSFTAIANPPVFALVYLVDLSNGNVNSHQWTYIYNASYGYSNDNARVKGFAITQDNKLVAGVNLINNGTTAYVLTIDYSTLAITINLPLNWPSRNYIQLGNKIYFKSGLAYGTSNSYGTLGYVDLAVNSANTIQPNYVWDELISGADAVFVTSSSSIGSQGSTGQDTEVLAPITLYTVPSNTQTVVGAIFATNHDVAERTVDIAVVPAGQTLSSSHHIRWDYPVSARGYEFITEKLTLQAGDSIVVLPSTADEIGFTAFGVELS